MRWDSRGVKKKYWRGTPGNLLRESKDCAEEDYSSVRNAKSRKSQSRKKAWRKLAYEYRQAFDISRDDIEQRLCVEDYNFIQDKKGSRQATFGVNDVKLVKKLKHN